MNNQKGFSVFIVFTLSSVVLVILIAGYYLYKNNSVLRAGKSTIPTNSSESKLTINTTASPSASIKHSTTPLPSSDPADNWKTYTYKKLSFKYPDDWRVIFDSEVFGQPNGFALHAESINDQDYAPDGISLSTFNDSEAGGNNYTPTSNRVFDSNDNGLSNIQFEVNGTSIYAGCQYTTDKSTIDICNNILATLKIIN